MNAVQFSSIADNLSNRSVITVVSLTFGLGLLYNAPRYDLIRYQQNFFSTAMLKNIENRLYADSVFMGEAFDERRNTDDPKGKFVEQSSVGAIITKNGTILARSANVLPPQLKERMTREGVTVTDDDRYNLIEHAERAAIFNAYRSGHDLHKATIYCTRFPCSDCARAIVWSGIKRAVFAGGFAGERRWLGSQRAALKILRESGVIVFYLSPSRIISVG